MTDDLDAEPEAGQGEHLLNACGYTMGATYPPSWMAWPMLYTGNPQVIEPGMVFFLHMILLDNETGLTMSLGEPAIVTDRTDGKLAHLDGLNLSRAWMLEGIAARLPKQDPRRRGLVQSARAHRESGLAAVTGEHYEGGHWLGSFAVYLVTARGAK